MKPVLLALAMTVSTLALTGCLSSSSNNGGSSASFQIQPVQGMVADTPVKVESTGEVTAGSYEGINDNRFEITFTADQKLKIEDKIANRVMEFDASDVHHSFDKAEWMKMYSSFISNGHRLDDMDPNFNDDITNVTVFTPTAGNGPEYALLRVNNFNNYAHWVLVGEPTSTQLSGQANYEGGYYLSEGSTGAGQGADTAQGALAIAANFGNGIGGTMDFTFTKPDDDTNNEVFGAASVGFQADVTKGRIRTVDGGGVAAPVALSGSTIYDTVDLSGGVFTGGNAVAGIVDFSNSADPNARRFGGWHAVKK